MKKEHIPDYDFLFRRSSSETFDEKGFKFTAPTFMIRRERKEKAISTNWSKYSTPEKTSICPITSKKYLVGKFYAAIPRNIKLSVKHAPSDSNFAHSTISGKQLLDDIKAYEVAEYLAENCIPVITAI